MGECLGARDRKIIDFSNKSSQLKRAVQILRELSVALWSLILQEIWPNVGSLPTPKTLTIFLNSSAEFLQAVVHDFVTFMYVTGVFTS